MGFYSILNVVVLCSTIRSSGNQSAFLFFVVWVLIGKFTLLSLFLAVIMEAFEVAHERIVAEHALDLQDGLLGTAGTPCLSCVSRCFTANAWSCQLS